MSFTKNGRWLRMDQDIRTLHGIESWAGGQQDECDNIETATTLFLFLLLPLQSQHLLLIMTSQGFFGDEELQGDVEWWLLDSWWKAKLHCVGYLDLTWDWAHGREDGSESPFDLWEG